MYYMKKSLHCQANFKDLNKCFVDLAEGRHNEKLSEGTTALGPRLTVL